MPGQITEIQPGGRTRLPGQAACFFETGGFLFFRIEKP